MGLIHVLLERRPGRLLPHPGAHRVDRDRVCGEPRPRHRTCRCVSLRSARGGSRWGGSARLVGCNLRENSGKLTVGLSESFLSSTLRAWATFSAILSRSGRNALACRGFCAAGSQPRSAIRLHVPPSQTSEGLGKSMACTPSRRGLGSRFKFRIGCIRGVPPGPQGRNFFSALALSALAVAQSPARLSDLQRPEATLCSVSRASGPTPSVVLPPVHWQLPQRPTCAVTVGLHCSKLE